MPKVKLQPGDVFEVELKGGRKAYLQYLFQDSEYLGGHLVRAFNHEIATSDLKQIVRGPIAFYSYTRLTQGIDLGLWERIGNVAIEKAFDPPLFRQTPDTAAHVQKSYKWNIFRAGSSERKQIGELTEEYQHLPVAAVFAPANIVKWLNEGKYPFREPE